MSPIVFNFYITAVMSSWRSVYEGEMCMFRTKKDFIMTGRKPATEGEDFPLLDSEYADDTGVLFDTRETLVVETPKLIQHFERFGMEIHLGNTITKKASKSQILFVAKPRVMYTNPDTYDGCDLSNLDLGNGLFIPIVSEWEVI